MTRPRAASHRFLTLLPKDLLAGLRVIYSPLMEVVALSGALDMGEIAAVLFTSGEAVRIASDLTEARRPAYCVGQRTTELARQNGWQAQCGGETADDLVAYLLDLRPEGRMLHLHGEHTRGEVAKRLNDAGLPCGSQVLYQQVLCPLSAEAEAVKTAQTPLIVPLFSPRSAAHFVNLWPDPAHLTLIAMSPAVANEMPRLQTGARHVSKVPTAQAMADLLRDVAEPLLRVEAKRPDD